MLSVHFVRILVRFPISYQYSPPKQYLHWPQEAVMSATLKFEAGDNGRTF